VADLGVLLDASVIIPAPLNDTLLSAAEAGLYRVFWSDAILQEVQRNLIGARLTTIEQAAKRLAAMRHAFPWSTVTGYEDMIDQMTNHPKDRHVVAAAVAAGATILVTSNLRDFPEQSLRPFGIAANSPDDFLIALDNQDPVRMAAVVQRQASGLHRPPMTPREVLDNLVVHAPQFAARLNSQALIVGLVCVTVPFA
jgi:predicted nucleic acid-binding protein